MRRFQLSVCVLFALIAALPAAAEKPDVIIGAALQQWTFDSGLTGWEAVHDCKISAIDGAMKIVSSSNDPYLTVRLDAPGPGLVIKLRARSNAAGPGQFFWSTDKQGGFVEARSKRFEMIHDGKWHEYSLLIGVKGTMKALRFDPAIAAGTIEIDSFSIHHGRTHPLKIERIETLKDRVVMHVRNISAGPVSFDHSGETHTIPGGKTITVTRKLRGKGAFEPGIVTLTSKGLPDIRRSVLVFRPEVNKDSDFHATVGTGDLKLRIPWLAHGARIEYKGKLVGVLGPIARFGWRVQSFGLPAGTTDKLRMSCQGIVAHLAVKGNEISVSIDSDERRDEEIKGPVLRAIGPLQQGLFAGLEYLGKGEKSSSKLDIETDAHMRMAPNPAMVTMPLMACVTDRATMAMTWSDMKLKPVFASPNVMDAATDHRMALRGRRIDATILVSDATLEDTILWAVKKAGGLPALPKAPLNDKAQLALDMRAINGPISGPGGWGHCAEAKWKRHYFADIASTIWRMTGKAPKTEQLVGGGAHVKNHAIYFVTGQAAQWLAIRRRQAKATIAAQKPDGSFRYSGKYLKGHFEDTSSGHCALRALALLEFANFTGDSGAKEAGLKALEFMKRFRTPRGAQTWELSLHTPDILASGNLVRAYVYGYELTGRKEYLALARKWAISGIPFVYLWSNQPIMTYATVPVYGATNFRAPLWIGLPVQWCGGVYAYGLTALARHDKSFDWNRLARGILITGRQMQYPDGPLAGCLPDIFQLASQQRAGPSINPCALISLQLALEGKVDSLAVAADASHRVVAPFPVTIAKGKARIEGKKGLTYQVIVDGKRIVTVKSKGVDEIDLAAPRPGDKKVRIKMAVYNVACGQWTTPEKVALEMKRHNLDILGLNEMPRLIKGGAGQQWCDRLASGLDMPYVYSGEISSANHGAPRWADESKKYEGKYKAILSKTPLLDTREFKLTGGNWNPASTVRAVTVVRGVRLAFYSLHVNTHWKDLEKVFAADKEFHVLAGGDYNHSNYPAFDKAANMRDGRWDVEGKKSIDRIFYRPNGKVKCVFNDVIRAEIKMSDHPYAVSVFEFDSPPTAKNPNLPAGDRN